MPVEIIRPRDTDPVVVNGLDEDAHREAPAGPAAPERPLPLDAGRLPLGRLAGLAGSGGFALWSSLTCFVC